MTNIDQHHSRDKTLNHSEDTRVERKHTVDHMALLIMSNRLNLKTEVTEKEREGRRQSDKTENRSFLEEEKKNRNNPVCSSNQQSAMTVKSVGLPPAVTFSCPGSASVFATFVFVRETIKDVKRNSSTGKKRAMAKGGGCIRVRGRGHSGCTCERLRGQLQQTVHTNDDDCTDSAQSMQGKEGGRGATDCVAIYQPKGWVGGWGEKKDLAYIRVLSELEGGGEFKG